MNELVEQYRKLSNLDLLKIDSEQDHYTPKALKIVRDEIELRGLTKEEISNAKRELDEKIKEEFLIQQEKISRNKKQEDRVLRVISTLNPTQKNIDKTEKIIRTVILVLAGTTLYHFYLKFGYFKWLFTEGRHFFAIELGMIEMAVPLFILPIGVFMFWQRKRSGWIMISFFLTYSLVSVASLIYWEMGKVPHQDSAIDGLIPTVSPLIYVFLLLFFGGNLYGISKEDVREVFNISKQTRKRTFRFAIVISSIFFYCLFEGL